MSIKRMQKSRSCVWEKYQYVITLYLYKYISVCFVICLKPISKFCTVNILFSCANKLIRLCSLIIVLNTQTTGLFILCLLEVRET